MRKLSEPKYVRDIVGEVTRFDEADQAMARGDMNPDSERWRRYYDKHPGLENQGRAWAKLPHGWHGEFQDAILVPTISETIHFLAKDDVVDGPVAERKIELSPELATLKVRGLLKHFGADLVGIGPLNQNWVYSNVGRDKFGDKPLGAAVSLQHKHAIIPVIRLNLDMIRFAPNLPSHLEVMRTYSRLAFMTSLVARYIRSLGYPARAHNLWNYQIVLPPVAVDAGLGELGRSGIVISPQFGNAIKMGAITTDLPLVNDPPVDVGVDEFCTACKICAEYCPVGAISSGEKTEIRGVRKWKLNDAACYGYHRVVGTDCGICLAVCPWNHSRRFPHNVIAAAVQRSGTARKIAITTDSWLGRRATGKQPDWMGELPQVKRKRNPRAGS
jgi:ferredoxin